jgi:hypothetical protein
MKTEPNGDLITDSAPPPRKRQAQQFFNDKACPECHYLRCRCEEPEPDDPEDNRE